MQFNFRQQLLESTLGSLRRTAQEHADKGDARAAPLFDLALKLKELRDPPVVEHLEKRRLKLVQAERQRA